MSQQSATLNVVFSLSAPGLLRHALRIAGRHERVIAFPESLGLGPINPPSPAARVRWMVAEMGFHEEDWTWIVSSVRRFWRLTSDTRSRRIVWTSSRSANEYSAFLAWIDRNQDRPFEVIDLASIQVEWTMRDGRTQRGRAVSLALLSPDIISGQALWDHAVPLDPTIRDGLVETWHALQRENSAIRLIGPDGLSSAPITAFDDVLLSYATVDWQFALRLIGYTLMHQGWDYRQADDHVLASRIVALVKAGRLELRRRSRASSRGDELRAHFADLPRDAEVRLPPLR